MKTILLWDPRFPDRRPARLTVEDTVASAAVRAGVAAAANPAEAGALSAGVALDPTMLTEVVLQHGNGSATRRVFLPYSVVMVGALAGVLASIGTPIAGGVTPTPVPINTALPAITGTAQEGQILTASTGTWSNNPTAYAYQWKRGGVVIGGSINATRTLIAADVSAVMSCTVTATNAGGSASVDTAGTGAVVAASVPVPVNTVAPAVTGTGAIGQVLTSDNGTWSNSPTSYAYVWRRGGVDIAGATAATYTLVSADAGTLVTCRVFATNAGGTAGATSNAVNVASASAPGSSPTNLAATGVTPTARYHIPSGSTVTTTTVNGAQVATNVTDMRGFADASNALGTGPVVLTDEVGRKVLSFTEGTTGTYSSGVNGPNLLQIADAFTASQRSLAVFMVVRVHKQNQAKCSLFSLGKAGASPPNTGNASLGTTIVSVSAPYLSGCSISASADAANGAKAIPGCQLQVIGLASRSTAGGGQLLYVNNDRATVAQTTASLTGTGATIGSYAFAPGTTDWFDLYEMVVVAGDLTNAQSDAVVAALVNNWGIAQITDQILLDGDSITDGITGASAAAGLGVDSRNSLGMQLTKPGSPLVPANFRVINRGLSGAKIADLVTRRDAANGVASAKLSGRNIFAYMIGRNDFAAGGGSVAGAVEYSASVALMNTTTTGYLQRGWECAPVTTVAGSSAVQSQNADYWAALRNTAQLQTDTQSGSGGVFAGKVKLIDIAAVSVSGTLIFGSSTAAGNTGYYQGDTTHPNRTGTARMADGGDTPANGYRALL